MKEVKTRMQSKLVSSPKKRKSFLFYIIVLAIVLVGFISLVSMQVEITQKNAHYETLTKTVAELNAKNAQLERYSIDENRMEYIEQIARDQLDYSYPDETIYYFIPQ